MKRHYFIGEDLADLKKLEVELESAGVDIEQIHVLSNNETDMEKLNLHAVDSISKKDVLRSGFMGLLVGVIGAVGIMYYFTASGYVESVTFAPALFLSLAFLGFCTWEGGLWGIQRNNRQFEPFQRDLQKGRHIFFVDIKPDQETKLSAVVAHHPNVQLASSGSGAPGWVIDTQKSWHRFTRWAP